MRTEIPSVLWLLRLIRGGHCRAPSSPPSLEEKTEGLSWAPWHLWEKARLWHCWEIRVQGNLEQIQACSYCLAGKG